MRAGKRHTTGFIVTATLLCQAIALAQTGPQPPCGKAPVPVWPALDETVAAKLWSRAEFGRDWQPAACTGWTAAGFTTLVSAAARFRNKGEAEGLLRRIGAISELAGMRYWSTTHQQWRPLILSAWALTDPLSGHRRENFTPAELKEGKVVYFEQQDNLTGKGVYRMQVLEASADRIVFGVANVSTMRYLFVPVFHAGDMQSVYFLDRESDNVWRFYSLERTGVNASILVTANESSPINRTVAFYRWVVGIPTATEPPAAR